MALTFDQIQSAQTQPGFNLADAANTATVQPNINTTQPNPTTVNPTPYTGTISTRQIPGQQQLEYYNTQTNQGFANPQALSTFVNQQTGGNTNAQNIFDALKQGYSTMMASGTPPATSQGAAYSEMNKVTPQPTVDVNSLMGIYEQLPEYKQFQADMQLANNQQYQSTAQYMQDLMKQYDVQGLDTKMINLESVINGTEADIANEVKAVGGFATQSQINALSLVRNKSLVQRYDQLQKQKESAMNMVNTMSSAYVNDRNFAMQAINQRLQFDQQALEIKTKMISAAQEGFNNIIKSVGHSGLYNALKNDPQAVALAEKTLGLIPGSLASLSTQNTQEWSEPYLMGGDYVQKNNKTGEIRTAVNVNAKTSSSSSPSSLPKVTLTDMADAIRQGWTQEGYIQGNGKISSKDYKEMKEQWKKQGFASSSFDSKFQDLIDKTSDNWKADYGYGT